MDIYKEFFNWYKIIERIFKKVNKIGKKTSWSQSFKNIINKKMSAPCYNCNQNNFGYYYQSPMQQSSCPGGNCPGNYPASYQHASASYQQMATPYTYYSKPHGSCPYGMC